MVREPPKHVHTNSYGMDPDKAASFPTFLLQRQEVLFSWSTIHGIHISYISSLLLRKQGALCAALYTMGIHTSAT